VESTRRRTDGRQASVRTITQHRAELSGETGLPDDAATVPAKTSTNDDNTFPSRPIPPGID